MSNLNFILIEKHEESLVWKEFQNFHILFIVEVEKLSDDLSISFFSFLKWVVVKIKFLILFVVQLFKSRLVQQLGEGFFFWRSEVHYLFISKLLFHWLVVIEIIVFFFVWGSQRSCLDYRVVSVALLSTLSDWFFQWGYRIEDRLLFGVLWSWSVLQNFRVLLFTFVLWRRGWKSGTLSWRYFLTNWSLAWV